MGLANHSRRATNGREIDGSYVATFPLTLSGGPSTISDGNNKRHLLIRLTRDRTLKLFQSLLRKLHRALDSLSFTLDRLIVPDNRDTEQENDGDNDRRPRPSAPLAYDYAIQSYEIAANRLNTIRDRLSGLATMILTVTLAVGTFAEHGSGISAWIFRLALIWGGVTVPVALYNLRRRTLRQPDLDKMWDATHREPDDFKARLLQETVRCSSVNNQRLERFQTTYDRLLISFMIQIVLFLVSLLLSGEPVTGHAN